MDQKFFIGKGSFGRVYGPFSVQQLKDQFPKQGLLLQSLSEDPKIQYIVKVSTEAPAQKEELDNIRAIMATAPNEIQQLFLQHFIVPLLVWRWSKKDYIEIQQYGGLDADKFIEKNATMITQAILCQFLISIIAILRCGFYLIDHGTYISDTKIQNTVVHPTNFTLSLIDLVFNDDIGHRPKVLTVNATTLPIQFLTTYYSARKYAPYFDRYQGQNSLEYYRQVLSNTSDEQALQRVNPTTRRQYKHSQSALNTMVLKFTLLYSMLFILILLIPIGDNFIIFRKKITVFMIKVLEERLALNWDDIIRNLQDLAQEIPILQQKFFTACEMNDMHTLKNMLEDNKQLVKIHDDQGNTCLMLACKKVDEELVKFLLYQYYAPVKHHNSLGQNAIACLFETADPASLSAQESILKMLLIKGANINNQDAMGRTPLLHAVMKNQSHIAALLLNYGADPKIADKEGKSANHYLTQQMRQQVQKLKAARQQEFRKKEQQRNATLLAREEESKIARKQQQQAKARKAQEYQCLLTDMKKIVGDTRGFWQAFYAFFGRKDSLSPIIAGYLSATQPPYSIIAFNEYLQSQSIKNTFKILQSSNPTRYRTVTSFFQLLNNKGKRKCPTPSQQGSHISQSIALL